MRSLKNKTVVITGASRGIGAALAVHFARHKCRLILVARNKTRLQKVVSDLEPLCSGCLALAIDITSPKGMHKVVSQALKEFGGIDIFVNNAGVGIHKPIEETTEKEYEAIMDTNLKAVFLSFRELIPLMRRQGGGQIINISSGAGRIGMPGMAVYAASKAALNIFSESVAGEVRNDNIKVSVLAPASVDTNFMSNLSGKSKSPSKAAQKLTVDDVAEAVIYLARQNANAWTSLADLRPLLVKK